MSDPTFPTGLSYKAQSASGLVATGPGVLVLVYFSASASAVINVYDSTSASGTKIIDSAAPDAKEEYDWPAAFKTGLYVELVSGTAKWTVFYLQ